MRADDLTAEEIAGVTAYVDVDAPPSTEATAMFLFGTNQRFPVDIAAHRYHQGLAPLIVVTGGVNRHNGIVEGKEFRRLLLQRDVPEEAIRCEYTSANTWQNVEFSMPYILEVLESGLSIAAVCKWYHRRAIHVLGTLVPDIRAFYAITWEPLYGETPITRTNWPEHPDGRRRVIREWQEVTRRVADGTFKEANLRNDMWQIVG